MKQVTLHVGYPKTGTTSLQRNALPEVPDGQFLDEFAEPQSNEGHLFPDKDIIRVRDALNDQLDLQFQRDKANYIALMRGYLETTDRSTVVLSQEGLTNPLVDTLYVQAIRAPRCERRRGCLSPEARGKRFSEADARRPTGAWTKRSGSTLPTSAVISDAVRP